jgi:chromosome segregation ATPase
VGLLVLPAFARRALRLSAARARMLAPLSLKEVVAERDLLRAEHAVAQHRLERHIEALRDEVARRRADLGRQAAMLVTLESETAERDAQIMARRRDILSLEGDLGASQAALNDFGARLDRAASVISALKERRLALETLADEQRTVIAGLETRVSGLEMELGDSAQSAKTKSISTEAERARLSSALNLRTSEVEQLSAKLNEALAKGAMIVADLEKKESELRETRERLAKVEATIASRDEPPALPDKSRLSSDFGSQGDLALRETISRLAADIVRLSAAEEEDAQRPNQGKAKRRGSRPPSSQGLGASKGMASTKLRQLQSTVPER